MILVFQTTGSGTGFNELLWQSEAQQVTADMQTRGYTDLARDWKAFYPGFHRQHPGLSVAQVEAAFVGNEVSHGIGKAAQQAGALLGQIPGAAAQGAENTLSNPLGYLGDIGDFFHRLTEASTWLRVGEVIAGLMILYVALRASMTPGGVTGAARQTPTTFKNTGERIAKIGKVVFK